jgi:ketosteroid isomerase-like protein
VKWLWRNSYHALAIAVGDILKTEMRYIIVTSICLMTLVTVQAAEISAVESAGIVAAVDTFHDALRRGDGKAAMELLAPDAMVLESGFAETRAQYEEHHLKEDIAFAGAVPSTRSVLTVQVEGDAAWLVSTSRSNGSFHGREINSVGTELIVLTKSSQGWRIRAIHWSSHDTKKNN